MDGLLTEITHEHKLRQTAARQSITAAEERRRIETKIIEEETKFLNVIPDHKASHILLQGSTPGGANFAIAEPTCWNGCVLIYLHGHRPVGNGLEAELDWRGACYASLLREGWLVAATSYRREDVIILDSQRDVLELRDYIVCRYGTPRICVLEGQSMGGGISTLMAERYPELVHGVLAVGAALMWRRDKMTDKEEIDMSLLHMPLVPILYLTNESELGPIRQYMSHVREKASSSEGRAAGIVEPALWEVSRPGHNWTNQRERLSAIRHLIDWIKFGSFVTCRSKNNTFESLPSESRPRFEEEKGVVIAATGRVILAEDGGCFRVDFTRDDLFALGIAKLGCEFDMTVLTDAREFRTLIKLDEYPFINSLKGDWIAFAEPERGNLVIALHNVQGLMDTTRLAGRVRVGDFVRIKSLLRPRPRALRGGNRLAVISARLHLDPATTPVNPLTNTKNVTKAAGLEEVTKI
jgi:pimeloyl-ACP methyl ester carboxylesterase